MSRETNKFIITMNDNRPTTRGEGTKGGLSWASHGRFGMRWCRSDQIGQPGVPTRRGNTGNAPHAPESLTDQFSANLICLLPLLLLTSPPTTTHSTLLHPTAIHAINHRLFLPTFSLNQAQSSSLVVKILSGLGSVLDFLMASWHRRLD